MSFLGSIVDSIGGGKAPPPPQKPPSRPNSANTARPLNNEVKGAPRPGLQPLPSVSTGTKRKAEGDALNPNAKISKPTTPTDATAKRAAAPPLHAPKAQHTQPQTEKAAVPEISKPMAVPTIATTPAKPPPKGSYAEMMARAKQSAEQRALSQVGTIKHQETKKDKMSKFAERRKMAQDKDKSKASKPDSTLRKESKREVRRSTSPTKKEGPQPDKSARTPPKSMYKGTMGMAGSRSRSQANGRPGSKKSRYDEYLGTDEEDEGEFDGEEEDDYGSDGSSDMEAGFDDVEMEESAALRAAKQADAEETALENKLKREKEERRQKLVGLAKKQK